MRALLNSLSKHLLHHQSWAGYWEPVIQCFKPGWREGYFRAQVKHVQVFAEQSVELIIEPEKTWPVHQAGQHIALTIQTNGRMLTRVFTIASEPQLARQQRQIRLLIRSQEFGAFTSKLTNLRTGQWLNISEPKGQFVMPNTARSLIMLAGGSGITPFIAMLKSLPADSKHTITLLYYAKPNSHWLKDELEQLKQSLCNFDYHLLERNKDSDATTWLTTNAHKHWLVCGPAALYKQAAALAKQLNTPIGSEHFSAVPAVLATTDKHELTLTHQGKTFTIDNQQTLLSHLQANKQPVTVGCGMGICHQCQCVKKQGIVRDIRTGELSDSSEQLIQLCISQPVSDVELSA